MLDVHPIRAFEDNYIWLLRQPAGPKVAVVDPGEEEPVLDALAAHGLELGAILLTHHHYDHVGGVAALRALFPEARVFGPRDQRIANLTDPVGEGERIRIPGFSAALQVMEVPGHTSSHVAYRGEHELFCGDTLFAAGCGRVFDGTFDQLAASLARIARLPRQTLCYCAHEYTIANLGFAKWVEPDSEAIAERQRAADALRRAGRPTVPLDPIRGAGDQPLSAYRRTWGQGGRGGRRRRATLGHQCAGFHRVAALEGRTIRLTSWRIGLGD